MKQDSSYEKETIFSFLTKVCINYAVSMISMTAITLLVGEDAKEVSSIFSLGGSGIPISILIIFLVLSILITGIRWLLFSTCIFRHLSVFFRSIILILSIGFITSAVIFFFDWFPSNMWQPWVAFIVLYMTFTFISIGIVIIRNKHENKNYEEALKKYLEEQESNKREKGGNSI